MWFKASDAGLNEMGGPTCTGAAVSTENSVKQLVSWLERNAPAGSSWEVAHAATVLEPLQPPEAQAIERAIERRRVEFQAGRHCAHRALSSLGYPSAPILMGPDRAPIWPDGAVASISHTGRQEPLAVAIAAHSARWVGLGIDVEGRAATSSLEIQRLTTKRERCRQPVQMDRVDFTDAIFTIKEASYKALYPSIGRFLDFTDVEAKFADEDFIVSVLDPLPRDRLRTVRGRWAVVGAWTVALAWA